MMNQKTTEQTLLSIKNLSTYFHTPEGVIRAVEGVNFDILKGACLGVLGESGCGKSVTALSIMQLIPSPPGEISSGSIQFAGKDLLRFSSRQMRSIRGKEISMIFQEPMTSLNPVYTVGNQIGETYRIHEGLDARQAKEKSIEMLSLVGIPSPQKRVDEYPHQLSGGMRQRVMIAMAIGCQPKLLIADEPTTALDVTIQAQILDLMAGLQEEMGMSIMMITHDLGVIAEISDKVVVMYAGQVVEQSSIDELFKHPLHPYSRGLLNSIPKLGDKFVRGKQPLREISGQVPDLINLPSGCLFASRCPKVEKKCLENVPQLIEIAPGHDVRCWLAG